MHEKEREGGGERLFFRASEGGKKVGTHGPTQMQARGGGEVISQGKLGRVFQQKKNALSCIGKSKKKKREKLDLITA